MLKPQYEYTASASDECIGPKFLRITDINKDPWISWDSVPYCKINDSDLQKYRIHEGDLLIARMADPGHGVLIEEEVDCVFASYLIRFQVKDLSYFRYLQYWQRSALYWNQVNSKKTGTTRANLNAQVLRKFQLLLPSSFIVHQYSKIIDRFRNRLIRNIEESQLLSEKKNFLLERNFTLK